MTKDSGLLRSSGRATLFRFAEQLLDNPDQLANYNTAKWNLVGHPEPGRRHNGEMPWLTRKDGRGVLHAYTLDVFSGVSTSTNSILTVRKDLWTDPRDPETWLALESNLETGRTVEHTVWDARVDAARKLWLEVAPARVSNQPHWYADGKHEHMFRNKLPRDQMRYEADMDTQWQAKEMEFRSGMVGAAIDYKDIYALESMIITVQRLRQEQRELVCSNKTQDDEYNNHGLMAA